MDGHEHHVAVLVDQLDGFLLAPVHVGLHQTAELADAVIDMHNVVADAQGIQLVDGHLVGTLHLAAHRQLVVALKDLMVRIIAVLRRLVDIAFVQRNRQEERLDVA